MNAPETYWKPQSSLPSDTVPTVFRPQRILKPRPRELTLQNAECGITLKVGEEFELELGLMNGTRRVRDEWVVTTDGDGTFRALQSGKTKIYVTGEPPNPPSGSIHGPRKLLIEIPVTVI